MSEEKRVCPDCKTAMKSIQIIDRGAPAGISKDYPLQYAAADSARSFWTGRYPVEGNVLAEMCDACGRIVLRGGPKTSTIG